MWTDDTDPAAYDSAALRFVRTAAPVQQAGSSFVLPRQCAVGVLLFVCIICFFVA